jgi:transposase
MRSRGRCGPGTGRAGRRGAPGPPGLAAEFTAGLRRIDARLPGTRKKLGVAVRASGSTVTEVFGAGPFIAATVTGDVRDVSRFGGRDRFAACNGTAPIEVSSGSRKVHRLSLRGNWRLNHAIHMAAITQIRYQHTDGRACYGKKLAEGKTPKEALRALKRQISDAIYKHMKAGAARSARGPGWHARNDSVASSHPGRRLKLTESHGRAYQGDLRACSGSRGNG